MPTCITYPTFQGYHFRSWKAKQTLYDASNCNSPCRDNNDKSYGIHHELKKDLYLHVDISASILFPRITQILNQPNCGLMWVYFHLTIGQEVFYDEHPILHQYTKYLIYLQPISGANDQFMVVKEAYCGFLEPHLCVSNYLCKLLFDSLICEELVAFSVCAILPSLDHIVDLFLMLLDVM